MQNTTPYTRLKNDIQLLEDEQDYKRRLLKEQLNISYERLKPLNLIRSALKNIYTSPNLIDNILTPALGLASGYLSRKIFVRTSGNLLRKIIGSVLQIGVTGLVAQHPDTIKSFGRFIIGYITRKKGTNSNNRVS